MERHISGHHNRNPGEQHEEEETVLANLRAVVEH